MFIVLVLLNAILFIAGFFIRDKIKEMEKIVVILISATLSFLIAIECFAGITSVSGTIINPWIGLFFAGLGAVSFVMFALRIISYVSNLLNDPDYFRKLRG